MTPVRDPFQDLEKQLEQLEAQVDKLILALDEWQQWKQEYDALRTDVRALASTATRAALTQTRQAFKGELVNEKELIDIFGRNDSKKRDQVISTVSNRLDYVSRNIATLSKQLEAAENKLAATRVVTNPEATDEDGLPITEISEQLDDDDNVISYTLRQPGNNQPQLLEALEKAGIKELPSGPHEIASTTTRYASDSIDAASSKSSNSRQQSEPHGKLSAEASRPKQPLKKKSVTFAEDTKEAEGEKPNSTVQKIEALYRQAKNQENIISDPIMPADESPEDAELREDMIRYNKETMMYEMAPIVAELALEEGSGDDDWSYDDSEEEDDDEDQWGRSTSGVVDDEYKRQMLELKERLSRQTFGEQKEAGDDEDDEFGEGIGRITVRHEESAAVANGSDMSPVNSDAPMMSAHQGDGKKSVRFASNLDIAEPSASSQAKPTQLPEVDPLSDVIERRSSGISNNAPASSRKPSRFRKERTSGVPVPQVSPMAPEKPTDATIYAPSGPEGQTLSSTILEHEPSGTIKEPDELDANFLHQQVTEEYYKMRNRMIGRQGGFLKENTDPIQPLEEEEGGPKRVSRFKAARLAKS
ncbi:Prefoldin subunit-domain-containing protein [Xylaria bambusicola]|uniref:Prefoldin subunit-domain-containing protein n=1 Tax=Xylaria bambusicola TaxID=326684 RepID=UPI002007E34C|nr:Prefoldin subunit-domain-containing protein [Xylaria bambusicola]KAI0506932.1 Prefoldin subunit-domain-containing protein [Xylaria bambusicola]